MAETDLIADKISVDYGDKKIIANISFRIKPGEFIAIIGKSGAGKTTLLNALAGLVNYKGKIKTPAKKGFVFQNYGVFPWMDVSKNITFSLEGKSKLEQNKICEEYLGIAGLLDYKQVYPTQLSGGQQQRLALVRACAPKPSLLLLDEPFSALDMHTRDTIKDWIMLFLENAKPKMTVMMTTHYLDEAIFLSDRIFVLNRGEMLEYTNNFKRPRNPEITYSAEFAAMKKELNRMIR